MFPFSVFPTRHSCHRSEWRDTVRHHNDGGTLSIIITENIKRHSERQRRIYYRNEEKRWDVISIIDSSLCVTIPFPVFLIRRSCLRSEWPETVRRHSKRQQRICYSVKERDYNGKNRDWVSLLVYKEVAGEAGRRILACGNDVKE